MPSKCLILESHDFSAKALKLLERKFEIVTNESSILSDQDDVEVMFVRLKNFIGIDYLLKYKNLKYICSPTTGLNHLDLTEINNREIEVISLADKKQFLKENVTATSEYTWALVMSSWRKIPNAVLDVNKWNWNREKFKSYQLKGKTLGIIGLGRVGKAVCNYAKVFGMNVAYYDPYVSCVTAKNTSLLSIAKESDIIVITCNHTEETDNFLGEFFFNNVKDGCLIVNTARGEIVNEIDLIHVLEKRNIFYSADVVGHEQKPNIVSNLKKFETLIDKQKVIFTPHIAGACYDAMWLTEEICASTVMDRYS